MLSGAWLEKNVELAKNPLLVKNPPLGMLLARC